MRSALAASIYSRLRYHKGENVRDYTEADAALESDIIAACDELAALRAEVERMKKALEWIRDEAAMGYEYRDKARTALGAQPKPKRGVAAFFGKWPGDETEAELLEKLKELDGPDHKAEVVHWQLATDPPEDHVRVLVVCGDPYIRIAIAYYEEQWKTWNDGLGMVSEVTHWMPLPDLPKEGRP